MLELYCNTNYRELFHNVRKTFDSTFLELDKGELNGQCNEAIDLFSYYSAHLDKFMDEFVNLNILQSPFSEVLDSYHARVVWDSSSESIQIYQNISSRFMAPLDPPP